MKTSIRCREAPTDLLPWRRQDAVRAGSTTLLELSAARRHLLDKSNAACTRPETRLLVLRDDRSKPCSSRPSRRRTRQRSSSCPAGRCWHSGTLDMRDKDAAAQSPLAERLFGIAGVSGVFFGSDFIAVTKVGRRMAAAQAGDPRRHHGAFHVRRADRERRRRRRQRRRQTNSSKPAIPRRSPPSRS